MREKYFSIDTIKWLLRQHPSECVLELDAPQKIIERLNARTKVEWERMLFGKDPKAREYFKQQFTLSEIYCPHEGVDRLEEYGIKQEDLASK